MLRRAAALAALVGVWVAISATSAAAHATLARSSPPADAELTRPPTEVVLTFTEPPDTAFSSVGVVDTGGEEVQAGDVALVPGDSLSLRVSLGDLPEGVYFVTWRVLSKTDGHITSGSFAFGVGISPVGAVDPIGEDGPREIEPPPPLAVAGRWGTYVGLAILLGGAVAGVAISRSRPLGATALLALGWVLAAASLGALVISGASKVGVGLGQYLGTSAPGRNHVALAAALAVIGGAVAYQAIRPGRGSLIPLGAGVAVAMLIHVLGGHANAPSALRPVNLLVQWVHVLAVSVWIGGLAWLLLHLRGPDAAERMRFVRRYSFVAGLALAVVALTGGLRVLDEVGGPAQWGRLFSTAFGITVVVKVGLFVGLAMLGARNRYVNIPRLGHEAGTATPLRRAVVAELAIAAGVFGVTGVMTELPPADVAAVDQGGPPEPVILMVRGNDFATTTRVRLDLAPGTSGPNRFSAQVTDFDTGDPVEAERVSLAFDLQGRPELASSLELVHVDHGLWEARGSNLALDGTWDVSVLVQGATASVTIDLLVRPRGPPQQIEEQPVPGQPTLYTVTLSDGSTVQAYVDPGRAGVNQVHFTFFDREGTERPVGDVEIVGLPPEGAPVTLPVRVFSPGHFVAEDELDPGEWRFSVRATADDGLVMSAYFEEVIQDA